MPKARGAWGTKFGFYLVAIGSACGLGNLWRFPYILGENGGGAFVLLYILIALVVGLPLLIGELLVGKISRRSLMTASQKLSLEPGWSQKTKLFSVMSALSILLSLVVLSYYAVISGWVLHFLMQFLFGFFKSHISEPERMLSSLMSSGRLQVGLASVHILFSLLVVAKGVQNGLERWIGFMMPPFAILLTALVFRSTSLPTSTSALRFLFYPDFSKLSYFSLMSAVGHVLFTLSVGFGTMVTFGSYMDPKEHIPSAGFRVTLADSLISLVAGLLIFPVVMTASAESLTDPTLLFEVLPRFLLELPAGVITGFAFFLCLYLAALGASIGLFESIVANIMDISRNSLPRETASWLTGGTVLLLATLPALSSSSLSSISFGGKGILASLDSVLINWMLPIVGFGMSLFLGFALSSESKEKEFLKPEHINSSSLYRHWSWLLKYGIPSIIACGLILQILGTLRSSHQ